MTFVLRSIVASKLWNSWRLKPSDDELPYHVLAAFLPPVDEKGRLSVYLAENEDQARKIAGAHMLATGAPGKCLFARTTTDTLMAAGINLEKESGQTAVAEVDALHRNLLLPSMEKVVAATRAFAAGNDINYEAPVIRSAASEIAANNGYDFPTLVSSGELGGRIWSGTAKLIQHHNVQVVSNFQMTPTIPDHGE